MSIGRSAQRIIKEEDLEVGLVYFGARYDDPQLHDEPTMSPAPLTVHAWGAHANPYAYVSGNLRRLTDPTGLCPESCPPPPASGPLDAGKARRQDAPGAPGTGTGGVVVAGYSRPRPRRPRHPAATVVPRHSLMNHGRAMAGSVAHAAVDKAHRVADAVPKVCHRFDYNGRHMARVATFSAEPTRGSAAVIESSGTPEDEIASVRESTSWTTRRRARSSRTRRSAPDWGWHASVHCCATFAGASPTKSSSTQ